MEVDTEAACRTEIVVLADECCVQFDSDTKDLT